jgi:hypothetical protein
MEEGRHKSKRLSSTAKFNLKLFSAQRIREIVKPLQFLELMKATFDCGGNTWQQSVGVRCHEGNSLDPRKNNFLKLMMHFSLHVFSRQTQDWMLCELLSTSRGGDKEGQILNVPQSCFKASKGWAITFMCRLGLALRRRTTICQKKCCISNALDGSEDVIVWEDDVEDKDDSDRVESTDNDSVCTRLPSTSSALACLLQDNGGS